MSVKELWDRYFNRDPDDNDTRMEIIDALSEFFAKNRYSYLDPEEIDRYHRVTIEYDQLREEIPIADFETMLMEQPSQIISIMSISCHRALNVLRSSNPASPDVDKITVRFKNYGPITSLGDLKSNLVDKFIALRCNVVRVSNIKPLVRRMRFQCGTCGAEFIEDFTDGKFQTPSGCIGKCRGKLFLPQRSTAKVVDFQAIRVQEIVSDEEKDQGRIPRTIECELTDDQVDCCIPGDVIQITGIVKARKTEIRSRSSKSRNKMLYILYVDVNSVSNGKENENGKVDCMNFNSIALEDIQEIANHPEPFKLIINSLCPTIYGHEIVKAGLCLALFGGNPKKSNQKFTVRADSHVLVVGDPGLGKSQILRACSRVSPRGVYVCGNTSTTSGLTVTMVKEGAGDYALEAGALVLADQGCCCIDEFDKMGKEHSSLLEAMEQQSISLAKAGIVCSLASRCAVLAAANPVGGHYDTSQSVNLNLKMNSALLSRFDLIFILLDSPNQARDRLLSEHVIKLHSGLNSLKASSKASRWAPRFGREAGFLTQFDRKESSLLDRLRINCDETEDFVPIPHSLLKKYIAYARFHVHPRMSADAKQVLMDYYLKMRKESDTIDGSPVTTRQLESLIRLAEARAKLELRTTITGKDAEDVVEIMSESIRDLMTDDMGMIEFKQNKPISQGKGIKAFVKEMRQDAKHRQSDVFNHDQMLSIASRMKIGVDDFQRYLDILNNQCYIIKRGNRKYKLQSGFL